MSIQGLDEKVNLLRGRLLQLLQEHQDLKTKIKELVRENQDLRNNVEKKEQQLINFQNQDKITKIVSSIADETHGNPELKLKINELIREIDKCIAHLSE